VGDFFAAHKEIAVPTSLPYLASNKNVGELFTKIASAAIPPKFTQGFLLTTIGLKGTNDRSLIPLLRSLGFLDQSGTPTPAYSLLKSKEKSKVAIAAGIKNAYAPLFAADEEASELSGEKLKSLVAQVAGTDDVMTARIASTFSSLAKLGDFKTKLPAKEVDEKENDEAGGVVDDPADKVRFKGLRTEFQYVIQVQLPSNGTEETYLNIFNAIRKTFQ
jgi:Family of unknown function (DUF5343)